MAVKLSPRESELLVDIVVRAGGRLPPSASELNALVSTERTSCRGLARKGLIDLSTDGQYRVNQGGLDRAKQIY